LEYIPSVFLNLAGRRLALCALANASTKVGLAVSKGAQVDVKKIWTVLVLSLFLTALPALGLDFKSGKYEITVKKETLLKAPPKRSWGRKPAS